jgi:hypothetical protein
MGLSRLSNFLKSGRGTILYVDPSSLDSTDSIENSGNSLTRPFKTIQRSLAEAARFSYQRGLNNDRFNKTTIVLYPGDHLVDNRPGYIPTGSGTFSRRSGETVSDLVQWDLDTNFDLSTPDNALYKLNSVHGGLIIPRGTSIVGMDLRKTRIRPTYVPNPENDQIERSCVLRVTGASYIWQFTILDADPNGVCFKDYTTNTFVPNFSHHKLTGFEYADGVNGVNIADDFLNYSTTRTDLDMYYEKIGICYGPSSGREIEPDYPTGTVDINPVIDEYRIVGSTGASVGITSIRSGDGVTPTTIITVDIVEPIEGLSVDSPIQISGISAAGYDGQFVVSSVISSTQFTYQTQNAPTNPLPGVTGSTLSLVVDTVTSASPYIFNISLRSVYGMCGLLADGDKATGFKSMVVAQYTGIGLQKDDNAFVKYDTGTGEYKDSTTVINLHTDSRARFKPEYENFHIKATNDSFLQLVSVFAIGYAQHFVTENGGDIALNNSNSNFGAKSLVASGFKRTAFTQDDQGYITHIIPPKEIEEEEISIEFNAIDVGITILRSAGAGTTTHLYLYDQTNENVPPKVVIDGYHVGAKENEELNVQIFESGTINTYSSRVVMPSGPYNATQSSSEKVFTVGKDNVGISSIATNTLTLTQPHSFINGESIRIIADNGHLPDGLEPNQVYYVITRESATGISTNQIRIAKTLSDAENGAVSASAITLNNKGGTLSIVSRVSDKNPGDVGHPVQFDAGGYWYINVASTGNAIYDRINALGTAGLGNATTRAYVTRQPDSRSLVDTLYRVRYVLPKESAGRPPIDGFILQESGDIIGDGTAEISQLYNDSGSISNTSALRNTNFIADASWTLSVATIRTELPHGLRVGDQVEIVNIIPTEYNGTYIVTSLVSAKEFTYSLPLDSNPGTLTNNTSSRTSSLPYFRRKKYTKTYQVYRTQEIQSYISGVQDGVYYLTLLNHSNRPTVTPFRDEAFAQPVQNLYPQTNNDNPDSDPSASVSHALPGIIGEVVLDDPQKSITKETLESFVVGTGITNIISSSGTAHTIYTSVDHGFSGITTVSVISGGANYGSINSFDGELYNARLVGFAGSTTGSNATAKITVTAGAITSVKIIDGGSAYGIGNTLTVVGVASTTSFVAGVVRVESIADNVGDAIKVAGITSASNVGYNNLYRISGIATGRTKEIDVVSSETISGFSTTGIGVTVTASAGYIPTGKVLQVSSLTYTPSSGIATVGFTTSHGFQVDNKIRISGANESAFNGDFIVKRLNSLTTLVVNVGVSVTTSTSATGTLFASRPVLTSYAGDLLKDTESASGRLNYEYAGITTVLGAQYTTGSSGDLTIPNAVALGFNLGDYLLIDNEVFRIDTAVTSDTVSVLRAVLGSPRQTHATGAVVRKIHVRPVELRRNSIIRASGHTFEYLGFGPGNYSTSLPQKQDRVLTSTEKFLAQATKTDGGSVVYTGMDSEGAFYAGNKKVNSATGQEESYDTPIPTVTGEKESDTLVNITDTQKLFVESSIKVEGGRDNNVVSEFDGPVVFNSKVTAYSDIEANTLFIQGSEEVSRQFSIINDTPTSSGNYGDILFNSEPSKYEFIGWTYVTENKWEPFGWIGGPGVGIASAGTYVGFSTLLNLVATGFTFGVTYDANSGVSTLTWDADPRIGIFTGANAANFVGNVKNLNFVGGAVSVTGGTDVGIATVYITSVSVAGTGGTVTSPGLPLNSLQWNDNDKFAGQSVGYYDPNLQQIRFGSAPGTSELTSTFFNSIGYLGFSTSTPSAKIEIVADNETSLYIKSTAGGNIVRVDNTTNDTTPFIIDGSGNVGINVATTLAALDVVGNAAVTGEVRIYETDRSNYVGLGVTTLSSDLNFKLPVTYGTNGQVLTSNGSGGLSWTTVSSGATVSGVTNIIAGAGISITNGTGPTVTVTNSGIRSLVAGSNIQVSVSNGVGIITSTASATVLAPYPFTTRGFSIPV